MYKFFIFIMAAIISLAAVAETRLGQVKHHQLQSKALADNRIQLDSVRDLRVYLPPDGNCLLSVANHCLKSKDYTNIIVADKQKHLQYLTIEEAIKHCTKGSVTTNACDVT